MPEVILTVEPGITGWTQLAYSDGGASRRSRPGRPVHLGIAPAQSTAGSLLRDTWKARKDFKLLFWTPLVLTFPLRVTFDLNRRAVSVSRAPGANNRTRRAAAHRAFDLHPEKT